MAETSSMAPSGKAKRRETIARWKAIVAEFERPHLGRASWQLVNSIGGYALAWALIYWSLSISWWLSIPFVLLGGGMLVRVFIIFHDCGHGSFLRSRLANRVWGYVTGVLAFSPYLQWKREHDAHHASTGNLDRRGVGDIPTLTVDEYLQASPGKRLLYRLTRNPWVLLGLAPLYVFVVRHRFASPGAKPAVWLSVWATNLGIALMAWGLIAVFGWLPWLCIQLAIVGLAGSAGFWLFYMQHQYDDVYWARSGDWDYTDAALKGSSFYRLPRVLQWFTGNIGYHHIHHLSHRIPNYHLERCHKAAPQFFAQVKLLTIRESVKALRFRLWDEKSAKLVGFDKLREMRGMEMVA